MQQTTYAQIDYAGGIVPPHDTELERVVLGALLVEPHQIPSVVKILAPEMFYAPKHEAIYRSIVELYDAGEPIDLYAVGRRLQLSGVMPGKITPAELTEIATTAGSASHTETHARTLVEKHVGRRMLEVGREITARTSDTRADIDEVIGYATGELEKIGTLFAGGRMGDHIKTYTAQALREAERRAAKADQGEVTGITTGLKDLDRATGGWQGSQLIVLAARPAMGKTALMLHFAKAAASTGVPVCIYSLEMSGVRLSDRLLLSVDDVDAEAFRSGRLTAADWQRMERAGAEISRLPIYVDDNPTVSMRYIKTNSRIRASRGECGMILIDYLQLADTTDKANRNRNREQEVAQASRQAKIIAKELNVPVILLSQLSRGVEGRADKCPMLSDLRESGAIEQDADIVVFLYRPAYYGISTIEALENADSEGVGILSIAKQRDGATGRIAFRHNPAMTRLTDWAVPQPIDQTSSATPF
ncbi:MAG: replicative DNA helicase [Rikenella sp.]|nr:replicative DNA helicase [Rikenella sp.]